MKKAIIVFTILFLNVISFAQKYYTVNEIPSPKLKGQDYFVSNPDGILSDVESINYKLVQLEQQTKIEFAVVVVNNFEEDFEDFEFAKALFDQWRIGKAGSNNGLLLFITKNRRKYRFISGSGVEGLLPDVVLKQIGQRNLLPAFRADRYEEGIINAIDEINDKLTNPHAKNEIQNLISQKKKKSFDWKIALGVSLFIILLFFLVFKLVNKKTKKIGTLNTYLPTSGDEIKKNRELKSVKAVKKAIKIDQTKRNGYDSVLTKGCAGVFFFVFCAIFILVFSGGFGIFDQFNVTNIPVILYVILAIGLFFRYYAYIADIRRAHFDDENFFEEAKEFHARNWWLIIFSPLIIIALIIHGLKKIKTTERFKTLFDSRNQEMFRLDRDINVAGEPFLTEGQRAEELNQAYDYDIWQSEDQKEHLVKAFPAEKYDDFTECPNCKFRTYQLNKQESTKAATYSNSGTAKMTNECSFCHHVEFIKWVTLAQLVRSSSSSSSSSSSGSSSSSSSGSFGGGRSNGGGAGGSW